MSVYALPLEPDISNGIINILSTPPITKAIPFSHFPRTRFMSKRCQPNLFQLFASLSVVEYGLWVDKEIIARYFYNVPNFLQFLGYWL